jgi:hypothetical protein
MPKLFCAQLRDHLILRHNRLSSRSGFVLTILLYTHNPIPKIPVHIFDLENIVKSCFLRTFGSRRPPTLSNLLLKNEDQNLWTSKITDNGRWLRGTVLIGAKEGVFIQPS